MDNTLEPCDLIELRHGPFTSTWEVVELIDAGARLRFVGDIRFVGFGTPMMAPNGDRLTENGAHSFLGRAHFHSTKRISKEGR